ncbi:MAG: rod shape-determining protein MreC [Dehalococcoidia bacterium]
MPILSRYSWWVGAMVGLALALALIGQVGLLAPAQSVFLRVATPVERGLSGIFEPVAAFLSDAGRIRGLQEDNRALLQENERLQNLVAELEGDRARVQELEEALGILSESGGDTLEAANVIGHDQSPFRDVITIDKGSSDGLESGMVVLSSQGTLVGTVTGVTDSTSFIRLLTDSRSRVNSEIQETEVAGVVSGGANRELSFELAQAEIKVGDHVVTSGLGGNYPPGRLIGTVSEVSGSTIETVLVLTSFRPQRVDSDDE